MEHVNSSLAIAPSDPWTSGKYVSVGGTASTASTATASATTTATTTATATPLTTKMTAAVATNSSSGTLTVVQSESQCFSPEPHGAQDADQDAAIWQVLVDLDRFVLEARKDHLLLAAEIEDLMGTLEGHCDQLGVDPANISHLLVFPYTAPITLTTRQALYRACDDLHQDILRRKERVERWISRIITIAENIREPPELYLQTAMPPMSRARILQLQRTYRTLEKEWIERLQRFQSMVGMLRVRWEQCGYFPKDDCDLALCKLFELADLHDPVMEISRIEAPLCLSKECLASLSTKLADLDQNFYTRQSRIRSMEHILGLIYQDLGTPVQSRVAFRIEATVKYAAELGRELKALQLELAARKLYQSAECWSALTAVWDTCLVCEQERKSFRSAIEQDDVTFVEKMERIQSEIDNCRVRFSKSSAVYKLMMMRSSHIERMIAFEQTARDPKRLFQSSFQLVEEEKFRRRAYPTLLKLENSLIEAIEKFEKEDGERFVYEGLPYLETLQAEIEKRHVNETVFAKFTPVIAAPTRSQTIQIMGRPISPTPTPPIQVPLLRHPNSSRTSISSTRSDSNRRSNNAPLQPSATLSLSPSNRECPAEQTKDRQEPVRDQENSFTLSLKSYLSTHQREASAASMASLNSSHSLKSKSSASSLSIASTSASASACSSPLADVVGNSSSYFTPLSPSTTSASTSSSSSVAPTDNIQPWSSSPKQDTKPQRQERFSFPSSFKTPSGSLAPVSGTKVSMTRPHGGSARRKAS
ncbi:microtubule associated protein-domain-containing protein [Dissophora ornata]|nr:microtubule associated protein-domain-containing protein [Dissophora ornata]